LIFGSRSAPLGGGARPSTHVFFRQE
jgi:hypothetical protein